MGKLKEKGLLHHNTHGEIQEMGIKSFLEAILCKSGHNIDLENVIEQFNEHGITLSSDDIAFIEKELALFSLECIDDDDIASISSEFKTYSDEMCRALADCKPMDDGLSSFDPPYRIVEEIVGYSPGDNISFEATAQDFSEIENNCEANADTDEQIKAIIEAMKMDW